MSQFKNNPKYIIYYTDTDSIFIGAPLDNNLISNTELGKFKLEHIFKEAVFLGPKIYGGITKDNNYICKVKGYKDSKLIPIELLKDLLSKDK